METKIQFACNMIIVFDKILSYKINIIIQDIHTALSFKYKYNKRKKTSLVIENVKTENRDKAYSKNIALIKRIV